MKPSSAKNKGRLFQKLVADLLLSSSKDLTEDDIVSRPMGSPGSDIMLSQAAVLQWPFDIECKSNKAGYTPVYNALEQSSARGRTPLMFFKQNRKEPAVAMYAADFLKIIKELNALKEMLKM